MKKFILVFAAVSMTSLFTLAETKNLNQSTVATTYQCSNGGTLQLVNTRYGNVKKMVFSKPGSINQLAYVVFWSMGEPYKGGVAAYMTFPDPKSSDLSDRSPSIADMEISYDGKGLVLKMTPIRMSQPQLAFSCQSY